MLRLTKRSVVAALPLFSLVAGCTAPATRIVVVVSTDLDVPGELSLLEVRVCAVNDEGSCPEGTEPDRIPLGTTGGAHALPLSFAVVPAATRRTSADNGQVLIEVVGTSPDEPRRVVRRSARLSFANEQTAVLPVFLSRRCFQLTDECVSARAQTCEPLQGGCVSDRVFRDRDYVVGGPLRPGAEFDVRLPDATAPVDAGPDAPTDAAIDATVDAFTDASDASDAVDAVDAVDVAAPDASRDVSDAGCVLCGSECVDLLSDPFHCGRCNNVCAPAINTTAECVAGACRTILCVDGFDDCNGNKETDGCEVDLRADPAHCTSCGAACPTSTLGERVCRPRAEATACGLECHRGFVPTGDTCVAAPVLLSPVSGSVLTRRDPLLSFEVPPGATTEIELCAGTRGCMSAMHVGSPSSSAVRLSDLSSGVWFWRVRGRFSDGRFTEQTPWWQFFVRPGAAATMRARADAFTGLRYDANLDGYTDLAVSAVHSRTSPAGGAPRDRVYFYAGASSARSTPMPNVVGFASRAYATLGFAGGNAGDVNGDGYADAIFTSERGFAVFHGSAEGLVPAPQSTAQVLPETMRPTFYFAGGAGDTNRDGYSDVLVATDDSSGLYLYTGGPGGLSATRRTQLRDTAPFPLAAAFAGFDANGDGVGDVVAARTDSPDMSLWLSGSMGLTGTVTPVTFGSRDVGDDSRVASLCSGDVNGDGYSDLIAGFPAADGGAGRVAVYFGAATEPFRGGTTRTVVVSGTEITGVGGARLGAAVATADFDGDGCDDVAMSMPGAGSVIVYRGAAAGLSSEIWTTLTTPGRSGIGFGLAASPSFDNPVLPTLFAVHAGEPAVLTSFRGASESSRVPTLRPLVLTALGVATDYKFGRAIAR